MANGSIPWRYFTAPLIFLISFAMLTTPSLAAVPSIQDAPHDSVILMQQWMDTAKVKFGHWMSKHPTIALRLKTIAQASEIQAITARLASVDQENRILRSGLDQWRSAMLGRQRSRQLSEIPITTVARRRYRQALAKAARDFENDLRNALDESRKRDDKKAVYALEAIFNRPGSSGASTISLPAHSTASKEMAWGGHRYRLIQGHVTWHVAKSECQKLGGHLVTITSPAEQAAMIRLANGKSVWIGGSCAGHVGLWKWVTGEPWKYANWLPHQPDNAGHSEFYAEMNFSGTNGGRWNDNRFREGTGSPSAYICEWDSP